MSTMSGVATPALSPKPPEPSPALKWGTARMRSVLASVLIGLTLILWHWPSDRIPIWVLVPVALITIAVLPTAVMRRAAGAAGLLVAGIVLPQIRTSIISAIIHGGGDFDSFLPVSLAFSAVIGIIMVVSWVYARGGSWPAVSTAGAVALVSILLIFAISDIIWSLGSPLVAILNVISTALAAWAAWAVDYARHSQPAVLAAPVGHPVMVPAVAADGTPVMVQRPATTSGLSIAAFVFALIAPLIGAILGHVALAQLARTGQGGSGLAKAAVIIGWVFVGLWISGILLYAASVGA